MKTHKYQRRFYRDWVEVKDLYLTRIVMQETDLEILTDKPIDRNFIKIRVQKYRWDIEHYINKDRRFLTTLKPLVVELNAAPIVREMAKQAKKANVGPMATVAGAIAQFLGRDLLRRGYRDVIIENGGDIFLKSRKTRAIGIYAGKSKIWNRLSLKINPQDTPLGICTSSGTVGHSLSFGCADSVVVLSQNAALADAVATACANRVQTREDLRKAVELAKSIRGVSGVVIVIKNDLVSWGKIKFISRYNT